MPGESAEAALDAAHALGTGGIGVVFTNLGERVATGAEAVAVRDHYLGVLSSIGHRELSAQISVKLTHLGLDVDQAECGQHLTVLAARAAETGGFVWIDMEESQYTNATLDTFRRARRNHANVGLCLQAYLRRTASDLESLLPLAPAIRLVKGAYSEPAEVAFPSMHDVDESFFRLACRLLDDAAATAVFGTHDMRLVARLREYAAAHDVPESKYEVHMLYGIRSSDQRALANDGCRVRVLISYGSAWFPWYMRRLAERPANVWFVIRNLI